MSPSFVKEKLYNLELSFKSFFLQKNSHFVDGIFANDFCQKPNPIVKTQKLFSSVLTIISNAYVEDQNEIQVKIILI